MINNLSEIVPLLKFEEGTFLLSPGPPEKER